MTYPLSVRLRQLSDQGIYIGTSSWKYPGWIGQVYTSQGYFTRGKFSKSKFDRQCLAEYAQVFPTVCGDFSFYQFPSAASWQRIFDQLPEGYRFSLKVPEEITLERYPELLRYGKRSGMFNGHFLDAELVRDQLLARLEPYLCKLGAIIFQFGTFHWGARSRASGFVSRLSEMLSELPTGELNFAVEIRNREFLDQDSGYLTCLKDHGVAHCLNNWTHMPPVSEQMKVPHIFTASHVVARFLLKPGRRYQQAVKMFEPYEKVQEPDEEGRAALAELVESCKTYGLKLFAFVNNRFEGNAVETIEAVT